MRRRPILFLLFVLGVFPFLQSCEQTCDVIPAQPGLASLRLVNAMAGVDTLVVYVDSVLFDRAYYNLSDTNLYPQTVEGRFGYRSIFRGNGSALRSGQHHIVAVSPSRPDVDLVDTTLSLTDNRQTIVFMGKWRSAETPAKALYLDDNTRSRDETRSLARFVHTVTDLDTLDVYFSSYAKVDAQGHPVPDLRIGYGQVSKEDGSGHGTGVSATDYFPVPPNGTGLLITRAHDTSDVVFTTGIGFNSRGFFATVIVRGETKPVGHEPVVSSTVLADGNQSAGTFVFSTTTFGVRLTNATREKRMSLAVKGNFDAEARDNVALQQYVKWIATDSTSRYWPLTPLYHGSADYFLSTVDSGVGILDPSGYRTTPYHFNATVDKRYTFVAIDSTKLGAGVERLGIVHLLDTMSLAGPGKTRVRFFNASPDHIANFTFGGRTFSLKQGEVGFADGILGDQNVGVTDGPFTSSLRFTLDSELPMTVFILPATASDPFPTSTAHN